MGDDYTTDWYEIVQMISEVSMDRKRLFCLRYSFQVTLYMLWRERNKLKHGDKILPIVALKKMIEKGVRNKLSILRSKGVMKGMKRSLQF